MGLQVVSNQKLKIKDIVTVTLLSLVNVVIFFAGSFLYTTPFTILLMPIIYSLIEGIVFFMIGTKVKKKGAILIYCFVRGVLGSFPPYIILYIVSGFIAELILWKSEYGNVKGLTISYIIIQIMACVGSTIYPYAIAFESLAQSTDKDGRSDNIAKAADMLKSWGSILLLAGVIIAAFIGALIGIRIVKKHLLSDIKTLEEV